MAPAPGCALCTEPRPMIARWRRAHSAHAPLPPTQPGEGVHMHVPHDMGGGQLSCWLQRLSACVLGVDITCNAPITNHTYPCTRARTVTRRAHAELCLHIDCVQNVRPGGARDHARGQKRPSSISPAQSTGVQRALSVSDGHADFRGPTIHPHTATSDASVLHCVCSRAVCWCLDVCRPGGSALMLAPTALSMCAGGRYNMQCTHYESYISMHTRPDGYAKSTR
jgi:hypothetical protein